MTVFIVNGSPSDEQIKALTSQEVGAFDLCRSEMFRPEEVNRNWKKAVVLCNRPDIVEYLLSRGLEVNGVRDAPIVKAKNIQGYFTGKRVALVGPAPHITKKSQARKLKGYDVICRINLSYPVISEVAKMTTGRTDIWYCSLHQLWFSARPILLEHPVTVRTEIDKGEFPDGLEHLRMPMTVDVSALDEATGCRSNRGFMAIMDILGENPEELYITGLTFYRGGSYHKGYLGSKQTSEEYDKYTAMVKGKIGNHDPEAQLRYFAENVAILPNVTMDKELQDVLSEFKAQATR